MPEERLGHRPIQDITKYDIENLVEFMETRGRKRGGQAGTALGPRSVRLMQGRLAAAFNMAVPDAPGRPAADPAA